jgi:hypothetical protein
MSEIGKTCATGATRSSGFEVPKTSNFGPRTVIYLTRLAQIQPTRTVPNVSAIANLFFSFVKNLVVARQKENPRFEVPGSKFRKP